MSNLPVPRPRWAIASTVGNEIEAQRVRSWLERQGITVRIQPVIILRHGRSQEPSAQIKIFVPISHLRKAQAILKDHQSRRNLRRGTTIYEWRYIKENLRSVISISIVVVLFIMVLLSRAW